MSLNNQPIGGDIELDIESLFQKKADFNFDFSCDYKLFNSGRSALLWLIKSVNGEFKILLPTYLCESVLQPFIQENIDYDFYSINSDFEINEESIIEKTMSFSPDFILFINSSTGEG